jgi:hypothetical protein
VSSVPCFLSLSNIVLSRAYRLEQALAGGHGVRRAESAIVPLLARAALGVGPPAGHARHGVLWCPRMAASESGQVAYTSACTNW